MKRLEIEQKNFENERRGANRCARHAFSSFVACGRLYLEQPENPDRLRLKTGNSYDVSQHFKWGVTFALIAGLHYRYWVMFLLVLCVSMSFSAALAGCALVLLGILLEGCYRIFSESIEVGSRGLTEHHIAHPLPKGFKIQRLKWQMDAQRPRLLRWVFQCILFGTFLWGVGPTDWPCMLTCYQ